jgi:hypothetical protein
MGWWKHILGLSTKVEETNTQKKLYWDIIVPKGYGTCVFHYTDENN